MREEKKLVKEYKPVLIFLVPPVAVLLAKHPLIDDFDLSSLKVCHPESGNISNFAPDRNRWRGANGR